MAASGFTPIQLYRTTTASAAPSAGNLADGELAINLTDKKLYAKDASNNVFVLADASSGGTTATNLAGGAAGSLPYQTGANATTFLGIGTAAQVLQVNSGATAPEWVNTSGTGNVARTTSPSFTTPSLGAATALSINSLTISTSTGTLTIANGKTVTINNTLTLSGTDATTMTFPTTSATLARTDAGQTFTGTNTFSSAPQISTLTATRVVYAGASGVLQDSASLTFDGTTLATTTVDATNVEVTNVKAKDGTSAISIANSTGVASLVANPILSAGTANGVLYLDGSKIATSGTSLTFNGTTFGAPAVQVDNLNLNGNTLSSTDTNGNIVITPNGTGRTTVTNLTTTSPRIVTGINDTNGNELFLFTATGSAVNEVTLANAATGGAPTFTSSGDDTNIDLVFGTKGTGQVKERVSSVNYALASQFDVGSDPNEIPLNQYLGTMAFQDSEAVNLGRIRLSGNITSTAWTTSGIRFQGAPATFTDTSSSGTVAAAYTNVFGGNTIAASSATTFTNYATFRINAPTAGTNVTFTGSQALSLGGFLGMDDDQNMVFGTSTGTKIGTAVGQKIGFWNVTPVVQPASANQAAVATTAATQSTPWGFTTQAQADGIITLLNEIRSALVAVGIIKGAA